MRAVIIDDDVLNIELLDFFCNKYAPSLEVVGVAEDVEQGIAVMTKEKPDLVFLDIELGYETGFDILRAIDQPDVMVIITSAFDQYTIDEMNIRLIDYLLKPLHIPQFVMAIEKCQIEYDNENNVEEPVPAYKNSETNIVMTTDTPQNDDHMYLPLENILRIESDNELTTIYTYDAKAIDTDLHIDEFEQQLSPYHFLRVHPCHIVHLNSIVSYERIPDSFLILCDESKIPVFATKKNEVTIRLTGS